MGYLFLTLSVLSGSIKGFFAKKISDKTVGLKGAIFTNLIRMLICMPIGLLFVLFDGAISDLRVSNVVLLTSAFAGITTGIFIVSWLLSVKRSAFTSVDAFVSLGILVPILLSSVFYNESVSVSQILGLILMLSAVFIMSLYNNQIKEKMELRTLLLLLAVCLSNGLTDFAYKIFYHSNVNTPASVFNFYIYVFSTITLLSVFIFLHIKTQKNSHAPHPKEEANILINKQKSLYITIMAIFLFCNSYFKTLATSMLLSVEVYPLSQGAAIILTLLMSAIFFKEKIKPLCIIGLCILFVALLLINVIVF